MYKTEDINQFTCTCTTSKTKINYYNIVWYNTDHEVVGIKMIIKSVLDTILWRVI